MKEEPGQRVRMSAADARALAENVLARLGFDPEEAAIIADHVVDAALWGYEYSGLPKLLNVADHAPARGPRGTVEVRHETDVSAQIDGGNNVGMLVMCRASNLAITKANARGFAIVGVNNIWMSGRCGYYVERIARAGLIAFHAVSSRAQVAPPGGRRPALGTNPMAFAFPTTGDPLVIDLGTSAFMFTDLMLRERRAELLPEGVAIDGQGRPTRDPALARLGAVLPFGGHKGFALAMAMSAFGLLAASAEDRDHAGYLIIAIKPDLLIRLEEYREQVHEMIQRIKATPRLPGVEEIRIPSERGCRERARALQEGIELDRTIYEKLLALSR